MTIAVDLGRKATKPTNQPKSRFIKLRNGTYLIGDIHLFKSLYPFSALANRADPDQAALLKELPDQGLLNLLMKYDL